ncbi:unnamed protein product, partial [Protopolystoma xenopodis]
TNWQQGVLEKFAPSFGQHRRRHSNYHPPPWPPSSHPTTLLPSSRLPTAHSGQPQHMHHYHLHNCYALFKGPRRLLHLRTLSLLPFRPLYQKTPFACSHFVAGRVYLVLSPWSEDGAVRWGGVTSGSGASSCRRPTNPFTLVDRFRCQLNLRRHRVGVLRPGHFPEGTGRLTSRPNSHVLLLPVGLRESIFTTVSTCASAHSDPGGRNHGLSGVIRSEGPTQADRLQALGQIKPLDPENWAARRTSAMGNGYIALLALGMAPYL